SPPSACSRCSRSCCPARRCCSTSSAGSSSRARPSRRRSSSRPPRSGARNAQRHLSSRSDGPLIVEGMGFLDRPFGVRDEAPAAAPAARRREAPSEDERAVERYRYLLRTAPPETIEQVHAEAFSRLTESQRALVYEELSKGAGTGERPLSSEPATLAR